MNFFHKEIIDRWHTYSIFEQMANIGAEVGRAISWKKKNNPKMSTNAFYRALELIDLTIEDKKNINSLKEILRLRELIGDYFLGKNIYHSDERFWEKYFYPFNLAARKEV
jgi:hypothetical protein